MSLTGNVLEFKIGDRVIQIFPVARPFVGAVVGINKVEGKVYVSWNGRVMQVDPEEIQLAYGPEFFGVSRKASREDQNKCLKIAKAFQKTAKDKSFSLKKSLIEQGFSNEDACNIENGYRDALQKRLTANVIDPLCPMPMEPVVILNEGGSKPGIVGILISIDEDQNGIVDISSSWSPVTNGSRLVSVPLVSIVPISNPIREAAERSYCASEKGTRYSSDSEQKRIACRAYDMFLNGIKNVDVFNNDNFKAWVQTNVLDDGSIVVSAVVEKDGVIDPLIERYPIFEQKLGTFNIKNKTDYQNAVQRINPLVDDCISAILQYFKQEIIPTYLVEELQQSFCRDQQINQDGLKMVTSGTVVIHDLNNDSSYEIKAPEEAKDNTDKSAAEEAFKSQSTVTMGKVVAEYKKASTNKIAGYKVLPPIPERYTDLSDEGLEGPFRKNNGRIVYYDPKEGKYYDRDKDMYLTNQESAELDKDE